MARRIGLLLVLLAAWPAAAHAASVTVTTTSDGDDGACTASKCTLRDAVRYSSAGTVVLPGRAQHYRVIASEIQVKRPLAIRGAGAAKSVIDATAPGQHRAFHLMPFPGAGTSTVTFRRVKITGAHTSDFPGGAGIDVAATGPNLKLVSSVVSGNRVDISGAGNLGHAGAAGSTTRGHRRRR